MRPRDLMRAPRALLDRTRGAGHPPANVGPATRERAAIPAILERLLTQNLLPFWLPMMLDRRSGGYHLNHNRWGRSKGPGIKRTVTQARALWFLARLVRSPFGEPAHQAAAAHGFAFLRDRLWDAQYGGFYWETDASGRTATRADKHVCAQMFALFALSEYARASGDAEAAELARRTFALCETHAHDAAHGGYRESFDREWRPQRDSARNVLGVSPALKLMDTHLHSMEALTAYVALTRDATAQERLAELVRIQSTVVMHPAGFAAASQFQADWTPPSDAAGNRVWYGHDLENLWLLIEATTALNQPATTLLDVYRGIFDAAVTYGFDCSEGGFFASGLLGQSADRREKIWWVQAEALVAALSLHRLTGESRYWATFASTLDWIVRRQTDWLRGEWYAEILPDGTIRGDKAGPWKSPYHNGRALLSTLDLLSEPPQSC